MPPRKIYSLVALNRIVYNSNSTFLIKSNPLCTINSKAKDHVAKDRKILVKFQQIPQGSKWTYVGNNSKVKVKGIGLYTLDMYSNLILYLYDMLSAPTVHKNLVLLLYWLN